MGAIMGKLKQILKVVISLIKELNRAYWKQWNELK